MEMLVDELIEGKELKYEKRQSVSVTFNWIILLKNIKRVNFEVIVSLPIIQM